MKRRLKASVKMKLFRNLLLITLPLIGLLTVYNFYAYYTFNEKFEESNQQSLALYAKNLQIELEALDTLLTHMAVVDYNFRLFSNTTDELQAHVAGHEMIQQLKAALSFYKTADAFFVYNENNATYRDVFASGYSFEQQQAIRQRVHEAAQTYDNFYYSGWVTYEVEDEYYLFRLLGKEGTYVVVMIDFSRIYATDLVNENVEVIYATQEGEPLTNRQFAQQQKPWANDRYVVVRSPIENSSIQLIFAVPKPGVFRGVFAILLTLSFTAVLLVAIRLVWLNRSVLSPWQHLVNKISGSSNVQHEEEGGNIIEEKRQEEYRISEFKQVDAAFTQMTDEIQLLKIKAYEQEIRRQKAELQHLQLQIRPHFYLNCLKSLYGMAQQKNFGRVQQLILAISNHLRYNFKDNQQLVTFQQEIEHVQNYILIQHISHYIPPVCEWNIDPALLEYPLPPLSIQTFVENSIKYAARPDEQLRIRVKAVILESEEGTYADITIQDNGNGFDEEILKELNDGDAVLYTDIHVGLSNLRHRLNMLYAEQAWLAFFNTEEGAAAEMILPLSSKRQREV